MARAPSSAARFEVLYRDCYQDLLGYALRRVDRPDSAADVVAETFLVAWRRIDEIPPDRARPWLFGVARNVMANQHRADQRRVDLAERLRQELARATVIAPDVPASLGAAFATLPEADQELLRLVAWEGLGAEDLAVTLDCSVNAARIRLHRARKRLAEALEQTSIITPLRSFDA
ncbi:RNA polymerase sigma factor [Dactylosporangium sp. NPDC048998]|uniref:RNA polymerase sigma factor n=1 Tax=Dactylosporangium sp. NPDC048998 TaxID=3363976 RepID=UPI0037183F96